MVLSCAITASAYPDHQPAVAGVRPHILNTVREMILPVRSKRYPDGTLAVLGICRGSVERSVLRLDLITHVRPEHLQVSVHSQRLHATESTALPRPAALSYSVVLTVELCLLEHR